MDIFQTLTSLNSAVSKLIGIASPFIKQFHSSLFYRIYTTAIFTAPLLLFIVTSEVNYSRLDLTVFTHVLLLIRYVHIVEIYINIFKYCFYNERIVKFVESIHRDDSFLRNTLKSVGDKRANCYAHLFHFISHVITVMSSSFKCFYGFKFSHLLSTTRHMLVYVISTQWSLCIYNLNNEVYRINSLIIDNDSSTETVSFLPSDNRDVHNRNSISSDKIVYQKKIDKAIEVYRAVYKKYVIVNRYYGINAVLSVGSTIYRFTRYAYRLWWRVSSCRKDCHSVTVFMKMVVAANDLLTLALMAVISQSAVNKVRFHYHASIKNLSTTYLNFKRTVKC